MRELPFRNAPLTTAFLIPDPIHPSTQFPEVDRCGRASRVRDSSLRVSGELARALERAGLEEGLRFLNARARFRFTGLYQRTAESLVCVRLYDRENDDLSLCSDPGRCTSRASFAITDGDASVGALYYLDPRPRILSAEETNFVRSAAGLFRRFIIG